MSSVPNNRLLYYFLSFLKFFCSVLFCICSNFVLLPFCPVLFCSFFSASVLFFFSASVLLLLWIQRLTIQRRAQRERIRDDSTGIPFAQMGRCFLFCITFASVCLPFCFSSIAVLFHDAVDAAPDDPEDGSTGKDLRRFHRNPLHTNGYREFSPYANFITANFITAGFQNYY